MSEWCLFSRVTIWYRFADVLGMEDSGIRYYKVTLARLQHCILLHSDPHRVPVALPASSLARFDILDGSIRTLRSSCVNVCACCCCIIAALRSRCQSNRHATAGMVRTAGSMRMPCKWDRPTIIGEFFR